MSKVRLDKLLANSGFGSRKEVKKIIKSGRVKINDQIISDPSLSIDPTSKKIYIDGEKFIYKKNHYIMMNKPAGVISATRDRDHDTVLDLLPKSYSHIKLFPVGRLDKNTEGLLLLSDDGKLAHRLLSPKNQVPKTYYARINGLVDDKDIASFKIGIKLEEDFTTLPAELEIKKSGNLSETLVTIYEGKYHQVKRMFKAVGKEVLYLKRLSIGNLTLDKNLQPGSFRELTTEEQQSLNV